MKKTIGIMMACLGMVLLSACKDKEEPKDTAQYAENFEIPRPGEPKSMVQAHTATAAKWEGVACTVDIACQSADSTQMVKDEFGQEYMDNVFDVRLLKKDGGTVLFNHRLTKSMFLSYIKEERERQVYAQKAVLKSVTPEIDKNGVFHYFNVCLQLPDAVDDDNLLFNYYTNGKCEQLTIDYMYEENPDEGV